MIVRYNQAWLDRWFIKHSLGVTIWPFIWYRQPEHLVPDRIRQHEEYHYRDQCRWLLLPWTLIYWANYLVNRIRGMNHYGAYAAVVFERKAREAENG